MRPKLLDRARERLRYLHYSLRTEQAYLYWARQYIRWSGLRHPRDMGQAEVEAFLTMLASERRVSVSTHRQALHALLFLYREVLNIQLPWLAEVGRPVVRKRVPVVLTVDEVHRLLGAIHGELGLTCRLLYGTGLRLMEALRLRTKDLDFDRQLIIVREGKGGKDRVVMMPATLQQSLRVQLHRARELWEADRLRKAEGVEAPDALDRTRVFGVASVSRIGLPRTAS